MLVSDSEDELHNAKPEVDEPRADIELDEPDEVTSGDDELDLLSVQQAYEQVYCAVTAHEKEPRSFADAMRRPDADQWLEAAQHEIQALLDNGTWELVELPPGRKAIGSRWVFKVKRNADGSVERYCARLVAQGFSQHPGFEFTETFAPTAKWSSLRAILALAALEDLELESVDISSAYLNGELDADVYMRQPEGFVDGNRQLVCKLLKSLYGLKQGGRMWYQKLDSVLQGMGFKCIESDHSIWVWNRDDVRIIIPVFVDDLTIVSKCKVIIQ